MPVTKEYIKALLDYIRGPKKFRYWLKEVKLGVDNVFRRNSAKMIIAACSAMLIVIFIIAIFYSNKGTFVVSVEPRLEYEGFAICETESFVNPKVRLFSDALEECNNISVNTLPDDLDTKEGQHNGKNYVAYTFFLKNEGKKEMDYEYILNIGEVTKNVDNAAWVMVYANGEPTIYAKERKDGSPERIYSYTGYPMLSNTSASKQISQLSDSNKGLMTDYDLEQFRYLKRDGLYELVTIPFESNTCIATGERENIKPQEMDKYTVVIWLEGDDPDCIDDIRTGKIGVDMEFTRLDNDEKK